MTSNSPLPIPSARSVAYRIPFNRASFGLAELHYAGQALYSGHVSGDGSFTKQCRALLEHQLGCGAALLTTSCTHALELSALLGEIGPGDEVLIPSFTFVSTVNAFVLRGARPVFVDIRADTLNFDESDAAAKVTARTRAMVPVHYAGVGCEMDALLALSAKHGIRIVEDNAHGLYGRYKGRSLGTFGSLSTLSFHETKNISCGEGGALIINDPRMVDRAEILREKGTNRSQFFRGAVDKYTWVDQGSSYLPSDILASVLYAQLERHEQIQKNRRRIWQTYRDALANVAARNDVQLPFVPAHCEQAYHMFYMLMPSFEARQGLIEHLKTRGICAVFHYVPLNATPMGAKFGARPGDCPVAESASDRLVRLPFYADLSESDQHEVIQGVKEFLTRGTGKTKVRTRAAAAVAARASQ